MKQKTKRHDQTGRSTAPEHWTQMLRKTMEEPAWRALSSAAQALYPWVKLQWRGPKANNNGKIRLSVRQAAASMGVSKNTVPEAFRDLQRKGFLVQTEHACLGVEGSARSPAYEVTELALPGDERHEGRKLYREWSSLCEFPAAEVSPNNPAGLNGKNKTRPRNWDRTVPEIGTKGTKPVPEIGTPCPRNRDEQGENRGLTVPNPGTSLIYHADSDSEARHGRR